MVGLGMSICARCLRNPIAKSCRHQGWVISSNGVKVEAPNQPVEDRATTPPRSVFLLPNTDLWGRLCRSLRPLPLRSSRSVGDSIICSTRRTFHLRSPPLHCRGSCTNHGIQSTRAPLPRLPGGRRNSGVSHCVSRPTRRPSPPPPSPGYLGRQSVLLGWKDEREGKGGAHISFLTPKMRPQLSGRDRPRLPAAPLD